MTWIDRTDHSWFQSIQLRSIASGSMSSNLPTNQPTTPQSKHTNTTQRGPPGAGAARGEDRGRGRRQLLQLLRGPEPDRPGRALLCHGTCVECWCRRCWCCSGSTHMYVIHQLTRAVHHITLHRVSSASSACGIGRTPSTPSCGRRPSSTRRCACRWSRRSARPRTTTAGAIRPW